MRSGKKYVVVLATLCVLVTAAFGLFVLGKYTWETFIYIHSESEFADSVSQEFYMILDGGREGTQKVYFTNIFNYGLFPRVVRDPRRAADYDRWYFASEVPSNMGNYFYAVALTRLANGHVKVSPDGYRFTFIFSPIAPDGTVIEYRSLSSAKRKQRFFAYSDASPKTSNRLVIYDDTTIYALSDEEISWYYQTRLKWLSPEQIEMEMQYREQEGLPSLGFNSR